jgi:hypothetical protein
MILFFSLFYFLSFSFPKIFCLFILLDEIKIFTNKNIIKESLFFSLKESFISILFFMPLCIWAFFYLKCSVFVFLYLFIAILFISIMSFIFQYSILKINLKIKKNFNYCLIYSFIKIIFYIFLRLLLYFFIGNLYTKNCICPIYFPLTPISYYSYLLPFFKYSNPWLYSLIYFFIIDILKNLLKRIFFYLIVFLSLFNYVFLDKNEKYYFENKFNKNNIENFIKKNQNNKIIVFPETAIKINKKEDIEMLKYFSKKYNIDIISGCKINIYDEKKNIIKKRNAAIIILKNEKIFIHKKKHSLPFTENINGKSKTYKKKENLSGCPYYIYICSEFFLSPIVKIQKNKKPIIIITSIKWADNTFLKNYKNIIKIIYKIRKHFDNLFL